MIVRTLPSRDNDKVPSSQRLERFCKTVSRRCRSVKRRSRDEHTAGLEAIKERRRSMELIGVDIFPDVNASRTAERTVAVNSSSVISSDLVA